MDLKAVAVRTAAEAAGLTAAIVGPRAVKADLMVAVAGPTADKALTAVSQDQVVQADKDLTVVAPD